MYSVVIVPRKHPALTRASCIKRKSFASASLTVFPASSPRESLHEFPDRDSAVLANRLSVVSASSIDRAEVSDDLLAMFQDSQTVDQLNQYANGGSPVRSTPSPDMHRGRRNRASTASTYCHSSLFFSMSSKHSIDRITTRSRSSSTSSAILATPCISQDEMSPHAHSPASQYSIQLLNPFASSLTADTLDSSRLDSPAGSPVALRFETRVRSVKALDSFPRIKESSPECSTEPAIPASDSICAEMGCDTSPEKGGVQLERGLAVDRVHTPPAAIALNCSAPNIALSEDQFRTNLATSSSKSQPRVPRTFFFADDDAHAKPVLSLDTDPLLDVTWSATNMRAQYEGTTFRPVTKRVRDQSMWIDTPSTVSPLPRKEIRLAASTETLRSSNNGGLRYSARARFSSLRAKSASDVTTATSSFLSKVRAEAQVDSTICRFEMSPAFPSAEMMLHKPTTDLQRRLAVLQVPTQTLTNAVDDMPHAVTTSNTSRDQPQVSLLPSDMQPQATMHDRVEKENNRTLSMAAVARSYYSLKKLASKVKNKRTIAVEAFASLDDQRL
ncbi:hypothetical protein BKA62DRAFT_686152 [Auriculariales sp. MPI-PUGE-AT-0066]|nr:hypothetical protein BKA62DRAFT_686152 [Auriculariales sp. MPI-PUGE-AT-0066]